MENDNQQQTAKARIVAFKDASPEVRLGNYMREVEKRAPPHRCPECGRLEPNKHLVRCMKGRPDHDVLPIPDICPCGGKCPRGTVCEAPARMARENEMLLRKAEQHTTEMRLLRAQARRDEQGRLIHSDGGKIVGIMGVGAKRSLAIARDVVAEAMAEYRKVFSPDFEASERKAEAIVEEGLRLARTAATARLFGLTVEEMDRLFFGPTVTNDQDEPVVFEEDRVMDGDDE